MKDRKYVFEEGRPAFYAFFLNEFRSAALDHGYTLTVHGSMARDLDLLAVPWVENASPVEDLVGSISACLGKTVYSEYHFEEKEERPHGRIVYTLAIASTWFIDLSIIKPHAHGKS